IWRIMMRKITSKRMNGTPSIRKVIQLLSLTVLMLTSTFLACSSFVRSLSVSFGTVTRNLSLGSRNSPSTSALTAESIIVAWLTLPFCTCVWKSVYVGVCSRAVWPPVEAILHSRTASRIIAIQNRTVLTVEFTFLPQIDHVSCTYNIVLCRLPSPGAPAQLLPRHCTECSRVISIKLFWTRQPHIFTYPLDAFAKPTYVGFALVQRRRSLL